MKLTLSLAVVSALTMIPHSVGAVKSQLYTMKVGFYNTNGSGATTTRTDVDGRAYCIETDDDSFSFERIYNTFPDWSDYDFKRIDRTDGDATHTLDDMWLTTDEVANNPVPDAYSARLKRVGNTEASTACAGRQGSDPAGATMTCSSSATYELVGDAIPNNFGGTYANIYRCCDDASGNCDDFRRGRALRGRSGADAAAN